MTIDEVAEVFGQCMKQLHFDKLFRQALEFAYDDVHRRRRFTWRVKKGGSMFEQQADWVDNTLCDVCGWPRLSQRAYEVVEPNVMCSKTNTWIGGYNKEKSEKWRAALTQAENELQRRCLKIWTVDGDWGCVCPDCLNKWVKGENTNG